MTLFQKTLTKQPTIWRKIIFLYLTRIIIFDTTSWSSSLRSEGCIYNKINDMVNEHCQAKCLILNGIKLLGK